MRRDAIRGMLGSLVLLAATGFAPVVASVSCACEHQGSTADGQCAALPDQEYVAIPAYHCLEWGCLQTGFGTALSPRYVYRWTPIGPAMLAHPDPEVPFVSYQCPRHHACGLLVEVWERVAMFSNDPHLGLRRVGGMNCLFFTGGEARPFR